MRVYRIGTTYLDLDHVLAVDEPFKSYNSCSSPIMVICVEMAFTGTKRIELGVSGDEFIGRMYEPIPDEYKGKLGKFEGLYPQVLSDAYKAYLESEFLRMKYNIWKPFLDAWENNDKEEAFSNQFNP